MSISYGSSYNSFISTTIIKDPVSIQSVPVSWPAEPVSEPPVRVFFYHFFFSLNWTMCIYVQPIAIWEGLQSPLYYQCFIFLEIIFHFPLRFGLNSGNLILCPNFPEDHRVWLIQYFSFIVLTMPIWLNWSDGRYEITCTRPLWGSLERNVDIWYLGWKS